MNGGSSLQLIIHSISLHHIQNKIQSSWEREAFIVKSAMCVWMSPKHKFFVKHINCIFLGDFSIEQPDLVV